MVTPALLNQSAQARAGTGYDKTCFTIDFDTRQVTCPPRTDQHQLEPRNPTRHRGHRRQVRRHHLPSLPDANAVHHRETRRPTTHLLPPRPTPRPHRSPHPTDQRHLAGKIQATRRRRRHHQPGPRHHRHPPRPLPRHRENSPPTRVLRDRPQPRPTPHLVDRTPPTSNPDQQPPTPRPDPRRLNRIRQQSPQRHQTRRTTRTDLHPARPAPIPARHRRRATPRRPGQGQGRAPPRRQVPAALLRPETVGRGHRPGLQATPGGRTRLARHEISARPPPGLPPPRRPHPRPRPALLARAPTGPSPRPPPVAPGPPSAPTSTACTPSPSPAPPARSGRPLNSPRPNATCWPLSSSTHPRRSSNSPQASDQYERRRLVTRLLGGQNRVSAAQPQDSCTSRPEHLWNPGKPFRIRHGQAEGLTPVLSP